MDEKQKEIWNVVLTYTDLIMQGKIDEFLEHFHEDYSGWSNIEPIPADKESIISELHNRSSQKITVQYDLIPIKIKIHDNIAVVHYYLHERKKDKNEIKESQIKHYTDILININNRWFLLADHFGVKIYKYFENSIEG
ncbi:hypothetical protein MNBD_IGNAVI01-350 [hydrothermal vent metagenome]|uniref:DUF4440 domain-containing protein n=1 Tax=hydrothermal vent metagenome TaxID=652676 RepID=A0A3B1BED5_9ZZZZ